MTGANLEVGYRLIELGSISHFSVQFVGLIDATIIAGICARWRTERLLTNHGNVDVTASSNSSSTYLLCRVVNVLVAGSFVIQKFRELKAFRLQHPSAALNTSPVHRSSKDI